MVHWLTTLNKGMKLATAVFNPSPENAEFFIDYLFPKMDAVELRKRVIAYDSFLNDPKLDEETRRRLGLYCDPIPSLFAGFDITKYGKTAREVLASWWPYISEILLNPETKLYPIMAKDLQVKGVLHTKEGIVYLRYLADRDYNFFYDYIKEFPRSHVNCPRTEGEYGWYKTRITYGLLKSGPVESWTFYCNACGEPFSEKEVYEKTVHMVSQ